MTLNGPRPLRWPRLIAVTVVALIGVAGFASLGVWQVQRLYWKRDLIQRVDSRIHADPVPAPGAADWGGITSEKDEYRRVQTSGRFLNDQTVLIYTPSDYGPADWVLTPLLRADGTIIMVNRGLVPEDLGRKGDYAKPEGQVTVTGLLRMPEDRGWLFSRPNDPATGHWYRRDIASITHAKGFKAAAPYFIDEGGGDPSVWPRGGQTVVTFRNAHLSYALTWFALALGVLAGYLLLLRQEVRQRGNRRGRRGPYRDGARSPLS
ncbi:SURF1 family protein [Xanthobacter sediminis]